MTKNFYFVIFLILGFSTLTSTAQNKWAVRASIGTASGIDAVDGFYYSFDIGIPILKSIEIAPTFNFFSTIPSNHIDNSWNVNFSEPLSSFEGKQIFTQYSGDVMGSVNLVLLFKPLALFNNPALVKHELAFGTGIGLKSYATVHSAYEKNGANYELTGFSSESNLSIEPYFGKVFYNYHFTDKYFAGLVASLDGFDGEAVALFGIQVGLNF